MWQNKVGVLTDDYRLFWTRSVRWYPKCLRVISRFHKMYTIFLHRCETFKFDATPWGSRNPNCATLHKLNIVVTLYKFWATAGLRLVPAFLTLPINPGPTNLAVKIKCSHFMFGLFHEMTNPNFKYIVYTNIKNGKKINQRLLVSVTSFFIFANTHLHDVMTSHRR